MVIQAVGGVDGDGSTMKRQMVMEVLGILDSYRNTEPVGDIDGNQTSWRGDN